MKIVHLKAENVKRLKAVEVTPTHDVVIIGGINGAGKTSLLDSIMYALAGKDVLPDKPVRKGKDKASIELDLGSLKISREISADGTATLKVKSAAGVPQKSPQTVLDALVGELTFDPLDFTRMKPKDQVQTLKELVGLDFTDQDNAIAAATERRLDAGRDLKHVEGYLASMPPMQDAQEKPVDVAAAMKSLDDARRENNKIALLRTNYGNLVREKELAEKEQAAIKVRINNLVLRMGELAESIEAADVIDEAPLREVISNASKINEAIKTNQHRAKAEDEARGLRERYDEETKLIRQCEDEKARVLSAVKFPVKTLSFDETGVLVAGVPFTQASQAEQLRVSLAMGMALNPKLRIMLVRDGSLLDDRSMGIIAEMAKANEYQIWVERVGEGDETAVIIEDGQVKQ